MKKILSILLLIASASAHSQNTGGVFVASKQQGFNNTLAATGQKILDGKAKYKDTINFTNRAFTSVAEANSYLPSVQRTVGQMMLINTGGSLSAGVITGGTNAWYYYKDGITDGNLVLMGAGNLQQVLTAGNQITAGTQMIKGTGPTVLQFDSLTNINWRHKGFFRLQADGGQQSATFTQTTIELVAGDSVEVRGTFGTGTGKFTVFSPTTMYSTLKTFTNVGTAGSDSVVVKKSDGTLGTISATYYGPGGSGTTSYQTQTASGSTTFTFTSVPASLNDYVIFVNGCAIRPTTDYTTSGNDITISTIVTGDIVRFQRIK